MKIIQETNLDMTELKTEIQKIIREELSANSLFSDEVLNGEQVCKILGISGRHLARLRQQKRIAYSQYGRKIFYQRKDVAAFIKNYRIETI